MDMRNKTYIYRTKNKTMETVDNRESIFELEEIYKYKDLIELEDKELIKTIICKTNSESNTLHKEFLRLVSQELDHKLTKDEFRVLKTKLMRDMKAHINA
tara:strand:- start:1931 stop:2230 length:300 start_codon:yes stop_codon:yes gene_type:complete